VGILTSGMVRLAYSVADAAQAIGISRSRLYEHISEGTIRPIKDGRRTLITLGELERFLQTLEGDQ